MSEAGSDGTVRGSRRRERVLFWKLEPGGIAAGVARRRWLVENPSLIETRQQAEKMMFGFACHDCCSTRPLHSTLVLRLALLLGGRRFARRYARAIETISLWSIARDPRIRRRMEEIGDLFFRVRREAEGAGSGGPRLTPAEMDAAKEAELAMAEEIRRLWPEGR